MGVDAETRHSLYSTPVAHQQLSTRAALKTALEYAGGRPSALAEALGISRQAVYQACRRHGIQVKPLTRAERVAQAKKASATRWRG